MPDYPSGTPLWLFVIVALIPAVSSIVVAVISSHKLDQASASNKADNEDLKSAIEDELKESSTIRRMDEKLDNDWEHGQELDRRWRKSSS
ncbi:hypothetical protein OZX57_06555 [Bifidobacterium sp. ESL0682]|uniref:hypothetical protein n=1 Tax=Bifidobacterium sp. ESL0682 TaxID=2983212 RepID=UPI0023F96BD1|nr:hypothetical protein [Bifidobacterium sp. ESL0682]WEV41647.1 hypothetical protein OZX57_06555 [Bifidobacterium sp. ESL0682]